MLTFLLFSAPRLSVLGGFLSRSIATVAFVNYAYLGAVLLGLTLWVYEITFLWPGSASSSAGSETPTSCKDIVYAEFFLEQALYVTPHVGVILYVYVACVLLFLAFKQLNILLCSVWLLCSFAELHHVVPALGISVLFGGLWSFYNDFSPVF
jgi:hypothetical protein